MLQARVTVMRAAKVASIRMGRGNGSGRAEGSGRRSSGGDAGGGSTHEIISGEAESHVTQGVAVRPEGGPNGAFLSRGEEEEGEEEGDDDDSDVLTIQGC